MTYGENAHELRESMASLLRWHRIQQRLGGPGSHTIPVTTTTAERERMGQIIARYRLAALTWCLQAVTATTPKTDLSATTGHTRTPVEDLRYRLGTAVAAAGPGERLSDLLAIHHDNHLLDAWQWLARAAALGEHDFTAGVNLGSLAPEQARTVLKDAADLTRGLVILDRRYKNVPGWRHLKEGNRLGRAAEGTSLQVNHEGRDLSVDQRGWRPVAGIIEGPALPGVAGAVQAQHNMLVDLARFPNALNLRRVLHSQAQVSHEAAIRATTAAPELVTTFSNRALIYRDLLRASRDVGGLVGGGGYAVVESRNAASRLQRTRADARGAAESLHELARLCTRTDARMAATVERGFHEKLYFVSEKVPQLTDEQVNGIHPTRQRWLPVTSPVQAPLLALVRDQLRLPPTPGQVSPERRESRAAFETAVAHEVARQGHARDAR